MELLLFAAGSVIGIILIVALAAHLDNETDEKDKW